MGQYRPLFHPELSKCLPTVGASQSGKQRDRECMPPEFCVTELPELSRSRFAATQPTSLEQLNSAISIQTTHGNALPQYTIKCNTGRSEEAYGRHLREFAQNLLSPRGFYGCLKVVKVVEGRGEAIAKLGDR